MAEKRVGGTHSSLQCAMLRQCRDGAGGKAGPPCTRGGGTRMLSTLINKQTMSAAGSSLTLDKTNYDNWMIIWSFTFIHFTLGDL